MNEPKRRGRPPKAKPCPECGQTGSHYDDCPAGIRPEMVALPVVEQRVSNLTAMAQAYAMRVWNGQSDVVPRAEKIERVKRALQGQNLPFEGVELP